MRSHPPLFDTFQNTQKDCFVLTQTRPNTAITSATTPTNRAWRDLSTQIMLIGLAALLYFAVRGITEADPVVAIDHGHDVLRFESRLGLDAEASLQNRIIDRQWLVTIVNWIYIWGHWPAIAGTLLWLQRTRRTEYLNLRNALFISGAIGLVIFTLYPVAPPRLLGTDQFIDTVTEFSTSYRVLQPPSLVNKYAALPSLHVGWNLLVGLFIWRHAKQPAVRALGRNLPRTHDHRRRPHRQPLPHRRGRRRNHRPDRPSHRQPPRRAINHHIERSRWRLIATARLPSGAAGW